MASSNTKFFRLNIFNVKLLFPTERILLTLWVGGMWTVGYIVAPTLFGVLDDRQLAGMIAGHLFTSMSYIGFVCGGLLLFGNIYRSGIKHKTNYILLLMLLLIAIGQFILQPMMADLKLQGLVEGSSAAANFGKLHGVSSILFMITSIAGLILVIKPKTA